MNDNRTWTELARAAESELFDNILPFWVETAPDRTRGGFHGWISNDNSVDEKAPKGLVMHARLLWAFSAVLRFRDRREYREAADRALSFLMERLADPVHGGFWWRTDAAGKPTYRTKGVHGQALALYGLCEALGRPGGISGRDRIIREADRQFELLECHARDSAGGGYREVLTEDWKPHPDGRLSSADIPCFNSMNTNLHVLEAYGSYCRVRRSPEAEEALGSLLRWFISSIYDPKRRHLTLYLDRHGRTMKDVDSYGHDIEAAWLLREGVRVLGDGDLEAEMEPVLAALADSVCSDGFSDDSGGLDYERDGAHRNTDRHWWVQAEALVGFRDRWEVDGEGKWLEAARRTWRYIEDSISDKRNGEWLWGRTADGKTLEKEKGGLWKTPYHNGRACMELMERIQGPEHNS